MESCTHRPDAPIASLLRADWNTRYVCARCGQPIRFAGRRPAAFAVLAAAWIGVFLLIGAASGLFRSASLRAMLIPFAGANLLTVIPWAALSMKYMSRYQPLSVQEKKNDRFHGRPSLF